ncbi:hypothetical protein O6H91_23G018100 [Diphasiastrum complanatum]|uniref:Uncharacterized protein n=1 Tax=Diphasiastrum complanatum TaxID=34168 RepID=A0ACC2A8J4_DIPCM|nr:hypothetical protein O6H91_23G018100 [Diphasiastrum complanatum]
MIISFLMNISYCGKPSCWLMACRKWRNRSLGFSSWMCFILDLFCLANLVLSNEVSSESPTIQHQDRNSSLVAGLNVTDVHEHMMRLNKAAVKSIQSPDGDTIDCVLLHHQLAFDHPKLRDHKLQVEAPSSWPDGVLQESESSKASEEVLQLWHQVGRCPAGTIPVRRTKAEDVLRAASVEQFGIKKSPPVTPKLTGDPQSLSSYGHEHAIGYISGYQFHGAQASINVWRPRIEVSKEFSLSQMWLLSGSFVGDLNSIEAGWQVSPELYGDSNPRFFTYWTRDGYQSTGCYNLLCSGFIQVGNGIAIGASIAPVSSYSGAQYDIKILIWKDPRTGNWWMRYGQDSLVGYWPAALFTHLRGYATMIEWGGEVVNTHPRNQHTATEMGSGRFPQQGFSQASYFRNIGLVDGSNQLHSPANLRTLAERPSCYDIKSSYNSNWGVYFYYGGPGQNPGCR